MKKKSISIIIALTSFALLGVVGMQYYFLRESYKLKSQLFDQSVNAALNVVSNKLEKHDAMIFLAQKAVREDRVRDKRKQETATDQANQFAGRLKQIQKRINRDFRMRDSVLKVYNPRALLIDEKLYEAYFREPDILSKVRLRVQLNSAVDRLGRVYQEENREFYIEDVDEEKLRRIKNVSSDTVHYLDYDPYPFIKVIALPKVSYSLQQELTEIKKLELAENRKNERLRQAKNINRLFDTSRAFKPKTAVIQDIANEFEQIDIPLKQRVNTNIIDSLLRVELANRDINIPFNYQISLTNKDSVLFTHISDKTIPFDADITYKTNLFPKDLVREGGLLTITFPNKNSFMVRSMKVILLSSGTLLIILIGCFAFTILTIIRQKKISEMKTDFINNMTHEFKTPVATIMIASEALKDPEIVEDKSRIKRLAGIIYDENVRLGNHIERVLNIARIDKDQLRLEHKEVEMNDLISVVVDSMSLQLQKRNAVINLDLKAERQIVLGDELHLSNVIFNLIDNAIKYSQDEPLIDISTNNAGKKLIIKVKDNGIGMSRDQLAKIFVQFYRVPTGNLHDVKGFGLGLSYVNNIVKHLQGTIHVKSEKDKGSEFEIILPVQSL